MQACSADSGARGGSRPVTFVGRPTPTATDRGEIVGQGPTIAGHVVMLTVGAWSSGCLAGAIVRIGRAIERIGDTATGDA